MQGYHTAGIFNSITPFKIVICVKVLRLRGSGELAQQLGAFDSPSEDLDSIPSTHKAANNHPKLQFQGIYYPLRYSQTPGTHMVRGHTCRKNTHRHKINNVIARIRK